MFNPKAIKHTPTYPDVYLIKAKILKNAGNYKGAAEMKEKARSLDTADRSALYYYYYIIIIIIILYLLLLLLLLCLLLYLCIC